MSNPEILQDYMKAAIATEEFWENFSDPARIPFDAIADQAEVDAQAGLFGVYLSAIDYDDEYYTLMDSIEIYQNPDFQYDSDLMLVLKTDNLQQTQNIAEDLHQVILRATSIQDFQDRHGLQLQPDLIESIGSLKDYRNFSMFYRDWEFNIIAWCQVENLSFDFLEDLEDQSDEIESGYEFFEGQEEVCQKLLNNEDYDRLDQLRAALKIGKFTFVHPTSEA
jgi:hypothetical protein